MKAAALEKKWPKIEAQLMVGDILLFHKRRGPLSKLIQFRSKSHWSHSALVFKDQDIIKYGSPLIIEAFKSGIEVHRLKKYTQQFSEYDIGVKRFADISTEQRAELVKSFMLNNIDVPYDYGVLFTYLFSGIFARISQKLYSKFAKRFVNMDAFVCSSFIHNAFHAFKQHQTFDMQDKRLKHIEQEKLITPAMIAADKDFEWIFNSRK